MNNIFQSSNVNSGCFLDHPLKGEELKSAHLCGGLEVCRQRCRLENIDPCNMRLIDDWYGMVVVGRQLGAECVGLKMKVQRDAGTYFQQI